MTAGAGWRGAAPDSGGDDIRVADGRALGCALRVAVHGALSLERVMPVVQAELACIDDACSRFRADSELERLNAAAGREVTVSPLLATAIGVALRAARLTDGAVDPTIGGDVRAAGYDRDFAEVPADGPALAPPRPPRTSAWQQVRCSAARCVAYVPRGVALDLGATAKALAADQAAAAALRTTPVGAGSVAGVLVSIGGDISVAGIPPVGGWQVVATDDSNLGVGTVPADRRAVIGLQSGGMATSSTTVRRWRRGGIEQHHIIDPASGRPARSRWRTVTVVAVDCVTANTATTAAIVRSEHATAWLESMCLPARLVDAAGIARYTSAWPV